MRRWYPPLLRRSATPGIRTQEGDRQRPQMRAEVLRTPHRQTSLDRLTLLTPSPQQDQRGSRPTCHEVSCFSSHTYWGVATQMGDNHKPPHATPSHSVGGDRVF